MRPRRHLTQAEKTIFADCFFNTELKIRRLAHIIYINFITCLTFIVVYILSCHRVPLLTVMVITVTIR